MKGKLYVLANLSIPDLVKVGKTTRMVEDRVKELSGATGVPNKFVVVYEKAFDDVDAAERYVHAVLESRGQRHADNREFFSASPTEVINVMQKVPREPILNKVEGDTKEDEIDDELSCFNLNDLEDEPELEIWRSIYVEALHTACGIGDIIQDDEEALKLYKKAADLGCPYAYADIGDTYLRIAPDMVKSKQNALAAYKKGVRSGDPCCYLKMASLFVEQQNSENYQKCLKLFAENFEKARTEPVNEEGRFLNEIRDILYELVTGLSGNVKLPDKFIKICVENRDSLTEETKKRIEDVEVIKIDGLHPANIYNAVISNHQKVVNILRRMQ